MSDDLLGAHEELRGEVLGVYYADRGSGFGVVELDQEGHGSGARCVGPLADLVQGQTVRLVGAWEDHPRHGRSFRAVYYEQTTPSTREGLAAFLRSERFEEVAERTVTRVLVAFGASTGRVIEHEPQRLVAEAGIDADEAERLSRAWRSGLALAELVRLVEPAKWPFEVTRRAHAAFGGEVVDVARDDPYALLAADRVGFAHVDRLARTLGVAADDPRRLAAGSFAAVVGARRRDGHEHLTRQETIDETARLLGVDAVVAADGLHGAVTSRLLEIDTLDRDDVVAPPAALAIERTLAAAIAGLASTRDSRVRAHAPGEALPEELTDDQRLAVTRSFEHGVSVLTGGPGTGKTRAVREIVVAADAAGLNVALCAPTGRAAKRLEEMTGQAATTIHRLLEARPDAGGGFRFRYGADERLPFDLVVADEISMCDTALAERLVSAIDDGSHLTLVGDANQLPSVGPGDVLRAVIASEVVPVTNLIEIHRQAAGSRIVTLAHGLLDGDVGELAGVDNDVYVAEEAVRERIVERVVRAVAERIPEHLQVEVDDVQVLAPVYRGPVGVDALNRELKRRLNPNAAAGVRGIDVGDRVMQTRNDADLDVANGDVGRVVDASASAGRLRVAFPRGEVTYDRARIGDLVHAWAVTVHKAQGGEWPVVVLVCDASHQHMLWRSLLYTAVTRARDALVAVGQRGTLRAAARHDRVVRRRTGLEARLRQAFAAAG